MGCKDLAGAIRLAKPLAQDRKARFPVENGPFFMRCGRAAGAEVVEFRISNDECLNNDKGRMTKIC